LPPMQTSSVDSIPERQNVICGAVRTFKIKLPCWWELDFPKSTQCAKEAKKAQKWDPFGSPGAGGIRGNRLFGSTFWRWWRLEMHFGVSARAQCQKASSPHEKSHPKDPKMGPKLEHTHQNCDKMSSTFTFLPAKR